MSHLYRSLLTTLNNTVLPPNTFLGGVSASITSPADYVAAVSVLVVGDISNFVISGSDVSFHVDKNYGINNTSFPDNSVTWILDVDGRVTGNIGIANNKDSLKYVFLPNVTGVNTQLTLDGCLVLSKVNFQSITTINQRFFVSRTPELKNLDLRNLTSITNTANNGTITSLTGLQRLYIGKLTSISSTELNRILVRNPGRNPTFYQNGNISGNLKVYHSASWGVADRNAFTRINSGWAVGDTCIINGLVYTAISGTPSADGEFDASPGGNTAHNNFRAAVNADTRSGSEDFHFTNDNALGCLISDIVGVAGNSMTAVMGVGNTGSAAVSWSPFRYGYDVHHALVDMRDIEGATLIEVGTPISVPVPTGLSYSNQTANTVDLNFTEPTPNANGTECYEVWVDDGTVHRKLFEFKEIAGNGSTLNLSEVITDVGTLSGTKIKIRTMDGQMNYSDFSNEITIA